MELDRTRPVEERALEEIIVDEKFLKLMENSSLGYRKIRKVISDY